MGSRMAAELLILALLAFTSCQCESLDPLCKGKSLKTKEGFHWVCTEGKNGLLGNRCRLHCEGGDTTRSKVETYCEPQGWADVMIPESVTDECPVFDGCVNVLKDRTKNGKWECTHPNKNCITPKPGSICELLCDKGFHQNADRNSVCKDQGWDPPIDDIRCLSCKPPVKPHQGKFNCKMNSSNKTICKLNCDKGFRPEGENLLQCELNGAFTPNPDTLKCIPAKLDWVSPQGNEGRQGLQRRGARSTCPPINKPDNGRFDCEGEVCRLICNAGYSAPIVVTARCLYGSWCTTDPGVACSSESKSEEKR